MGFLDKVKELKNRITSSEEEDDHLEEPIEEKEESEEIPDRFKIDLQGFSIEQMLQYEADTEKHAVWGGSVTKQFKKWADADQEEMS